MRRTHDTLPGLDIEGIGIGPLRLEDLVDREALGEMVASFEILFGIPIRVLSASGNVLAAATVHATLCGYVNELDGGRRACNATVAEVKQLQPGPMGTAVHPCFTGAVYRVIPIEYDRKALGRVVLGPYLPVHPDAPPASLPRSLLAVDPGLDPNRLRQHYPELTHVPPDEVEHLVTHLTTVLDVILFSGHKALLTSKMHLASIRESYRELAEKNDKLAEAYQRLKELDRLKSNFLATVSHELRTPLTSIMGYGEMLSEGMAGPLNEEQQEFVQTIRTKSDQLLGLIMSLLDLSKLESGTATIRRRDVAVLELLEDAVSTMTPTAARKGVSLSAETAGELPTVAGDPDRLRQVFLNLTENAIKFTPSGGSVHLSARMVTVEAPDDEVGLVLVAPLRRAIEVRVADTGVGIPEVERGRVFDPFYQIDQSSTREHGGTGLGLSIVKRLVEAHAGTVRIESNHPLGAVFVVTLPVSRSSVAPPSRRTAPPAATPVGGR